jgi:hypothetical protein
MARQAEGKGFLKGVRREGQWAIGAAALRSGLRPARLVGLVFFAPLLLHRPAASESHALGWVRTDRFGG